MYPVRKKCAMVFQHSTLFDSMTCAENVALPLVLAGVANADVCVSGGRRVQVSGCANVADAVAPYVPPPAYYAPMPYDPPPPPNVTGCVSYNGRWVNAAGCN